MRKLTIDQARRVALAAQGFADPRPQGRVTRQHIRRVLKRTGVIQIDSVNVVARAHYLPLFARLGNYPLSLLDEMTWGNKAELTEYWAHMAAIIPKADWPLYRHRMESKWHFAERWIKDNPGGVEEILSRIREHGPIRPSDLEAHKTGLGPWWEWSPAKIALEGLFLRGKLGVPTRVNFVRHYDLVERIIPRDVLAEDLPEAEQRKELLRRALRHQGVATFADLTDYHRQSNQPGKSPLKELVAAGEAIEVEVEGWKETAYLDPAASVPKRVEAVAFLCPFDPVIWFRARTERLFDFHYRIEIYTPAPKRTFGYYVFAILCDGELVGRLDLKADRARSALIVRGAFIEAGHSSESIAPRVRAELKIMAEWLSLTDVIVEPNGGLAEPLARA
ncbi:MAG: winged helix-turn-helix domain-containing protein [Acidimicrobiia bacterium]